MIGIYKITNKINQKCYIGQSVNIKHRWSQHKQNSKIRPEKLYLAIRKYGIENFSFEVIEECKQEELDEKEKYYIILYNSYENGYNMNLGGQNTKKYYDEQIRTLWDSGLSVSEIALQVDLDRETISRYLKDYKNYSVQESNRRGGKIAYQTMLKKDTIPDYMKPRQIFQYDIWGNKIGVWSSVVEISKILNIDKGLIGKALKKEYLQAGGYQWSLENKEKIKDISKNIKLKFGLIQKDLKGNILNHFNTIKDAAIFLGKEPKSATSISKCLLKHQETAYGYKWEYDYSIWDNKPYQKGENGG